MDLGFDSISNFFNQKADGEYIIPGQPGAVEEFYKRLEKEGFNLEELKDILECEDNLLIVSAAGAGKTTTLILKILRDIVAGKLLREVEFEGKTVYVLKKVLVCTFLKTGAKDIADKFDEFVKKLKIKNISSKKKEFKFSTIDSEVYAALREGTKLPNGATLKITIGEEHQLNSCLREACNYYKIRSNSSKSYSKRMTEEELGDISCLLSYTRSRLDNLRFSHPIMPEYNLGEIELKGIIEQYNQNKIAKGIQDFGDLEDALYDHIKKSPKAVEFLKNRYDYVYIDEFQDTSQLQYAIMEPYLKGAERIMIMGDEDQCIYSWRGSDIDLILNRVEKDYNPTVKKLSVNRRCAKTILNAVVPSIEQNTLRHDKELKASKDGGEIDIVIDGGVQSFSNYIKEDMLQGRTVGVLGRTNADLIVPAMVLLVEGYKSFSIPKQCKLTDGAAQNIIGVLTLLTKQHTNDFERLLKLFLKKNNEWQATKLCDVLSTSRDYTLFNLPLEDIQYSAPDLFYVIRGIRRYCSINPYTKAIEGDPVKAYIYLLDIMQEDVYNTNSIYAQRARDLCYYIKKLLLEHEKFKNMDIFELETLFIYQYPKLFEERQPKKPIRKKDSLGRWHDEEVVQEKVHIELKTVHDAKGKEWDNVYIWNNVNGCFPNSVGNRELTDGEFEEERRVHYIAWTRPKKKLVVFTRSDVDGGFLEECDLTEAKIIKKNEIVTGIQNIRNASVSSLLQNKKPKTFQDLKPDTEKVMRDYILKYTDYKKICTNEGVNLDKIIMKMGNTDKLIEYMKTQGLEKYPKDMLESSISLIIESYLMTNE